jgi:hypothetical protein
MITMNNSIYDIKTGKEYKSTGYCMDGEYMVQDEAGNKVLINSADVINENELIKFKQIFKLLCNKGNIYLENEKYTIHGDITIPCTDYLKTTLFLDNEKLLTAKCKLNNSY